MIAIGTPLLKQTIPDHILSTYLRLNQAAADYYSLVVSRMHVNQPRYSTKREWVEGVRALGRADEQLYRGIAAVRYGNSHSSATGKREIQSGLATLRHTDSQIRHADALLGVHQSGPTVGLPMKVLYKL